MKKVLIISYYWPPSGGAGVQRWVKLTNYLSQLGVKCFVLTVDENKSSYTQFDHSLLNDIHPEVEVIKTDSFEIINWFSKFFGKKNVPTAGFSNVNNSSIKQKLINSIRSNFFIPDPRNGWNKYAFKAAKEIIEREGIKNVITTSPPHSTQLIGDKLKKEYNINWIADFRDPWTDIYYYSILQHSFISHKINSNYEKKIIENCDQLITVSEGLKSIFGSKTKKKISKKVHIVPNGFDPKDFINLKKQINKQQFIITYTGTMSDIYNPYSFIKVLNTVVNSSISKFEIILKIVGNISKGIQEAILTSNIKFEFVSEVPHSEINQYQKDSDMLLLVIPETENSKGILTGKLFEYLASENPIMCLGEKNGDASKIIEMTNTGKSFDRSDIVGIEAYLKKSILEKEKGNVFRSNMIEVAKYSRLVQADYLAKNVLFD